MKNWNNVQFQIQIFQIWISTWWKIQKPDHTIINQKQRWVISLNLFLQKSKKGLLQEETKEWFKDEKSELSGKDDHDASAVDLINNTEANLRSSNSKGRDSK